MEASGDDLRDQAIKNLKAKRDFMSHLATFAGVNVFLILIWAVTGGTDEFFWPIFPIIGWGVFGILPHYWSVYRGDGITEDKIQQEMSRMGGGVSGDGTGQAPSPQSGPRSKQPPP